MKTFTEEYYENGVLWKKCIQKTAVKIHINYLWQLTAQVKSDEAFLKTKFFKSTFEEVLPVSTGYSYEQLIFGATSQF